MSDPVGTEPVGLQVAAAEGEEGGGEEDEGVDERPGDEGGVGGAFEAKGRPMRLLIAARKAGACT